MNSISIDPINPTDFRAIIQIADECFGKNYLSECELNKMLESQGVFLKVHVKGKTIGFSITFWKQENEKINQLSLNNTGACISLPYGVIKTIAIKNEFQLQGIGTKLIEASLQQMKTLFGAKVFLYLAWTESKSFLFTSKLKKLGFKTVEIIPNYWYQESLNLNYGCLRCGNPPCNCSLTLFKLTLK